MIKNTMMYTFWHGLLVHCSSLILTKTYKFFKKSLIIHYRYFDFLFSGLFLHLLIKILLFSAISLQLDSQFNLILLFLCLYVCTLVDIYYYIHYIIHRSIKYVFYYLEHTMFDSYIYQPENIYWRHATRFKIKYEKEKISENYNSERDRFHFFKHFFSFFISIRYFIIREPYLFSMLHILVFTNYLQDYSLSLLFVYLFIIQISRFVFFMGPNVERFRFVTWNNTFTGLLMELPFYFRYELRHRPELQHLKSNINIDPELLLNFTKNNINLMMYFALRYQVTIHTDIDEPLERYHKLSELYNEVEYGYGFSRFSYMLSSSAMLSHRITEFYEHIPNLIIDSQRFVKKNQGFWLASFIFYIYFEYTFISALIMAAATPQNNVQYIPYTTNYVGHSSNIFFDILNLGKYPGPATYEDIASILMFLFTLRNTAR